MPVSGNLGAPASASLLELSNDQLFVAFISSKSPTTNEAWCPDVRAVLPILNAAFSGPDTPELAFIEVGQKPEYANVQAPLSTC
ncbi:uncharacterized protein LY89DRAFT_684768 [Mollisia scopiformis]|uniref:Thioredoxin domain-containing protein n=1 Tax=Mollisia scopiformis TaxID=149040 RepID=A0A194X964_MOLSC|nr:uncharacterized protein LY89DRAFT_684768 [Mollisia scopiformis]KUJ16664.1 hypothetical protein LY89DRAFT_684768 [Mollisia scopiformis]